MADFRSYRSYRDYALAVTGQWRYSLPTEHVAFMETVLETSVDKVDVLAAGQVLFRAQVGHDWEPYDFGGGVVEDIECPLAPDRMKPRRDRAYEGRANPKGIPYLYVATHERTVVAEVRPWIGALVSVAQVRTTRELRLLNCTTDGKTSKVYMTEPAPDERQRAVWRDIDQAFAEPVSRTDDVADYAPTQRLAEMFRQRGLDGIGYRSALGPGHNLALFDLDSAEVLNCYLMRVDSVSLEYSQVANPYFVKPS